MVEGARENRIVLMVLGVCLCLVLMIFSSCREKEQAEGTGQDVPAEETTHTSSSEQMVWTHASEKSDLRILYAGLMETDRARDFVAFLAARFETVETTEYLTFKEAESTGFDVTILDHDGLDVEASRLWISRRYDRATIAVGVPGARVCSRLDLKTAYL